MNVFSKKSILAIIAMFIASVIFVGCGSDNNGGGGDDPVEPAEGLDLLSSSGETPWVNPNFTFTDDGEGLTCGAWYYHSEFATMTNVQIKDGEISWTATLEKSDGKNDKWPYAEMCVAFDAGALNADAVIHLIYTSDRDIELVLNDNTVLDNGLKV
ncbi:MAG: hypothetical protein LBH98_08025, partial [Chitinispirillales bacterium]|nr:hypothetical protein [Chitinispirillales bacterium]